MRILITGGYGFVGTQLLRILPKEHQITVLDNLMGYAGSMPSVPNNHTFVFGDIRDAELTGALVRYHDVIIHLAGIVGYPACQVDRNVSYAVNVTGTKNIADALTRTQKVIFISSSSVYGHQNQDSVDERTHLRPLTGYAEDKVAGEEIIKRSAASWVILRPATAFGASDRLRLDLLPNTLLYDALVKKEMRVFEPNAIRPFIHVLDFARALEHIIKGNVPWNQTYNIGNPELTMRKIDLVYKLAAFTWADVVSMEGKDEDQRNYWLDTEKFAKTGFKYLPYTIDLAFDQLKSLQPMFEHKYEEFSSPYQLRKYLDI
jgi:nucleoside-diphosphate-sugar epimerase